MAAVASTRTRLKREECTRTKHDPVFSDWQILIGPSDWEEYSLGKDGVEKYRIHNLPISCSCPGIYELGVPSFLIDGLRSRKHDSKNIIVVYLGQADNVRTRLQQYGRRGGHLDHGSSTVSSNNDEKPGLFKEVFSRGYSIMFRWAPIKNKKEAEKTEADLLDVFDYAWNRRRNGASRRDEILERLDSKATSSVHTLLRTFQSWKNLSFAKRAGIKIDTSLPPPGDRNGFLIPPVLKFGKSQIRFIPGDDSVDGNHDICGVSIGDGSVCRNRPVFGRKRCEEHKGKKISGSSSVERNGITERQTNTIACGVYLEDGSQCMDLPAYGRKRCELHKGRRVTKTVLTDIRLPVQMENQFWKRQPLLIEGPVDEEFDICGVVDTDGAVCRNRPVSGRKRCEQHKGQRISSQQLSTSKERCETKITYRLDEEAINICGVVTDRGSVCRRRPVRGRKRCEEHKGRRITGKCY